MPFYVQIDHIYKYKCLISPAPFWGLKRFSTKPIVKVTPLFCSHIKGRSQDCKTVTPWSNLLYHLVYHIVLHVFWNKNKMGVFCTHLAEVSECLFWIVKLYILFLSGAVQLSFLVHTVWQHHNRNYRTSYSCGTSCSASWHLWGPTWPCCT